MYLLNFLNVGKKKTNFTEKVEDLSKESLEGPIKKNINIKTKNLRFFIIEENEVITICRIVVGVKTIGILEIKDLNKEE